MKKKLIPSVSAVLIYKDQVFLIKRQDYLKAFPGYHSFPGGKVDTGESLKEALLREVQEECGFDISGEECCEVALAHTPDFNPVRFETHFFAVYLTSLPQIKLDLGEAQYGHWYKIDEFMVKFKSSKVLAVPPLVSLMSFLQLDLRPKVLLDIDLRYDGAREVPMIESVFGVKQFMPLSQTFPPAKRTNCFLVGKTLIDPSPESEEELHKLYNSLAGHEIQQVLITHHHPDHHQFAPNIAEHFQVPIFISKDSHERIRSKWGDSYFSDLAVKFLKEGDLLEGRFPIYSVPGHDEGQLAISDKELNWMIVSDLYQTIGSVVIGAPEGDMKKYFETLERVIALGPKVIFPSHGIATGGTHRLQETLDHRRKRETQILKLHREGKNREEIMDEIYKEIDPLLFPYALKTIDAHAKKLKITLT